MRYLVMVVLRDKEGKNVTKDVEVDAETENEAQLKAYEETALGDCLFVEFVGFPKPKQV